jgi:hypothetical protein
MANIKVYLDNNEETVAEYFIADEYVEIATTYILEAIRLKVVDIEKKKLLEEIDATLAERVNDKVAIIK